MYLPDPPALRSAWRDHLGRSCLPPALTTRPLCQVEILELLTQQGEDHWLPWHQKRPLLHIACERGAWNCVQYLVSER